MNEQKRVTVSLTKSQVDFILAEMCFVVSPGGWFVVDTKERLKAKRIIKVLERAITEEE